MNMLACGLGVVMAVASAVALYAASAHCLWPALQRRHRGTRWMGALLAVTALVLWIVALGPAVGMCAMLATWMLTMVSLPYLALLTGTPDADRGGDD